MRSTRLENIFGAVALAAYDAISRAAAGDISRGGATAAALNLVGHAPGMSIDLLASGLGLSHPGTVRIVDGLVAENFVTRSPSIVDRRSVELYLTPLGTRRRRALLNGRHETLDAFLSPLNAKECRQLDAIVSKLLRAEVANVPRALATCRFCDERACEECPVSAALEASA